MIHGVWTKCWMHTYICIHLWVYMSITIGYIARVYSTAAHTTTTNTKKKAVCAEDFTTINIYKLHIGKLMCTKMIFFSVVHFCGRQIFDLYFRWGDVKEFKNDCCAFFFFFCLLLSARSFLSFAPPAHWFLHSHARHQLHGCEHSLVHSLTRPIQPDNIEWVVTQYQTLNSYTFISFFTLTSDHCMIDFM